MKKYTEGNRSAWNTAARYHQDAKAEKWLAGFRNEGYTTFDEFDFDVYNRLQFKGKSVVQAPCNSGHEVLSFINMGAREGVGFDIADENIAFARQLRAASGITSAHFVRTDVYSIPPEFDNRFDLGVITVGSISWMPDLRGFLDIYRRLLKKDGVIFIYEMHPLTMVFPYSFRGDQEVRMECNYFEKEPLITTDSLDYFGQVQYESPPQYNFQYPVAEVIQTLLDLGFALKEFREYPHDIGNGHVYLEGKLPLSYHVWAEKK